jgi:hypothetical protein
MAKGWARDEGEKGWDKMSQPAVRETVWRLSSGTETLRYKRMRRVGQFLVLVRESFLESRFYQ